MTAFGSDWKQLSKGKCSAVLEKRLAPVEDGINYVTEFNSKYQKIITAKLTVTSQTEYSHTLPCYSGPGRKKSTLTHPHCMGNMCTLTPLFLHQQLGEQHLDSHHLLKTHRQYQFSGK